MLVLPEIEVVRPRTVPEVVTAIAGAPGEAMLLAGGTDLVPNLKHGLFSPKRLVSLRRVASLREVREDVDGRLVVGSGVTLADLAADPRVRLRYPALADAAGLVAGPQIRNVATLGGNVMLDTRCRWYNQTHFWRSALGFCLKKDGQVCHVVPKGQNCVATISTDTPGPLFLYGAEVRLASARGERAVPIAKFFVQDGIRNTVRADDEIVTAIALPPPAARLETAYAKLAVRQSIDFPILSIAVSATRREDGRADALAVIVGAVGSKPRVISGLEAMRGEALDDKLARAVADRAWASCRPLSTISVDEAWRREMVRVEVRRAFGALRPSA